MLKRRFLCEKNKDLIGKKLVSMDVFFKEWVNISPILLKPISKKLPIFADGNAINRHIRIQNT